MNLLDTRIYPDNLSYKGKAVKEIDHYEILKTYNLDDAKNIIFDSTEQAASQKGYTLLKVEISYESGILYHLFDVKMYYVQQLQLTEIKLQPTEIQLQLTEIESMQIQLIPLLKAITPIIVALISAYIVYMATTTIVTVMYGNGGEQSQSSSPFTGLTGVILILGFAYILIGKR